MLKRRIVLSAVAQNKTTSSASEARTQLCVVLGALGALLVTAGSIGLLAVGLSMRAPSVGFLAFFVGPLFFMAGYVIAQRTAASLLGERTVLDLREDGIAIYRRIGKTEVPLHPVLQPPAAIEVRERPVSIAVHHESVRAASSVRMRTGSSHLYFDVYFRSASGEERYVLRFDCGIPFGFFLQREIRLGLGELAQAAGATFKSTRFEPAEEEDVFVSRFGSVHKSDTRSQPPD